MFADEALANRILTQRVMIARSVANACASLGLPGPHLLEMEGAVALFAGDSSPITQVNGVRPGANLAPALDFYRGRTKRWEAIVSPFSGVESIHQLVAMGARAEQFENMTYRSLKEPIPDHDEGFDIREVKTPEDRAVWKSVVNRGFHGDEHNEVIDFLGDVSAAMEPAVRFLAYVNDQPAAGAALFQVGDFVALGGAATLPEFRGKGLHAALVSHRLKAASHRSDLAIMEALPGSSSQRNAERFGFRIAYTQLCFAIESQ